MNASNRLFRISHLFAPQQFADRLLALHALFASIDQLNSSISDDQVAKQKLEWWLRELQPGNIPSSRHPVVRQLQISGASHSFTVQAIEKLIAGAYARMEARAPSNSQEFRSLCQAIYQPRIRLECSACGSNDELIPDFRVASINGGLIELLRESCSQSERAFWWIPLNLLAKFGISRRELKEDGDSRPAKSVFRELFEVNDFRDFERKVNILEKEAVFPEHSHMLFLAVLQSRQLVRMSKERPSTFAEELTRRHMGDVFAVWKLARNLNRNHTNT